MTAVSRQMASTSVEAGRVVGEIASAVTEVAIGAERQACMSADARQAGEDTSESATRMRELAGRGMDAMRRSREAFERVREMGAETTQRIASLGERSGEIG
jgi:methyl-accepting chemotaxis protein